MEKHPSIQLVECPRDAMQSWPNLISTDKKVDYLNLLLHVGFHTVDFGSFVSHKAIPQMTDTAAVVKRLDLSNTNSRLLAIVLNVRGAEEACGFEEIKVLGFPFSISPTFQMRNAHSTIEESLERVEGIQNLCLKYNKELVIYLSMGFGNPYGDVYNEDILLHWADEMARRDVKIISLADTVGMATPGEIIFALKTLIPKYAEIQFGVHLHSTAENSIEKLRAALDNGCRRFDGALKGIGGCPMAQDHLIGNMDTEKMITFFERNGFDLNLDKQNLNKARSVAENVFV